jgi:sec-independent protein translocase protein TatB
MFGIGFGELLVVVLVIFLVNGPDRLPEMARKLGKLVREFKRVTEEVKVTIEREINRPTEKETPDE